MTGRHLNHRLRIVVVGAYGLIGTYVAARLAQDGHEVIGVGRDVGMARRRLPGIRWISADLSSTSIEAWADLLIGVDAIVNCAGALQDSPRDDLRAVHVDGIGRLLEACHKAAVERIIHISAAGLAEGRPTAFNSTKLAAEAAIEGAPIAWTILRPGLVLAPVAYGGSALLRGLAACPYVLPLVYPHSIVQVVAVTDVARAVAGALGGRARNATVDLVHPDRLTLETVVTKIRRWLGLPDAPSISIPPAAARAMATACDALAVLGWRSPMRTTTLEQLRAGIEGDARAVERELGIELLSLDEMLAASPAGVQERWFAKSYGLKPLLLFALFAFWLLSGFIGLVPSRSEAIAVLTVAGISKNLAGSAVIAGSVADIALAIAVCFRRSAVRALQGMLALSALYLIGGTLVRPDLWLDPMGSILKTIPAALLAAAALAMMDER